MDAVQKVGNGHPGTAMSLAPVAYLLFQKVMRHNPADPEWVARDRFVLSCGHSSITLYTQLFLGGYGLELDDLKALRTWGSKTPGHPELGHTAGVEVTTGPLGQGVGNAVGMALSGRRVHGLLDASAAPGESLFDHQVYVLASDGDLEEGVSSEVSSIAGTQQLGNLTMIYDRNRISIEGDTDIAFTEDVAARYAAYGWHVQTVDWTNGGKDYVEDVPALYAAIRKAHTVDDKPSLIVVDTVIAWPAPNAQGTEAAHGSALGAEEVAATKKVLGFDPDTTFEVPPGVLERTRGLRDRGATWAAEWDERFAAWSSKHKKSAELLQRLERREMPTDLADALPTFDADEKGVATRSASGKVINALAPVLPELWGGSADLAGSNNTTITSAPSVGPVVAEVGEWSTDPYAGRVLHFGIREHGMGAIMNGIAADRLTRVFGGTFLTFSDYMRGSVRVAALSRLPVTYVWTHDSIGLGEDGLSAPADRAPRRAPRHARPRRRTPCGRQRDRGRVADHPEPHRPAGRAGAHPAERAGLPARHGRVHLDRGSGPRWLRPHRLREGHARRHPHRHRLGGPLAVEARTLLAADGISARVVSLPCLEWFEDQDESYRDTVLPPTVKARVSVEAGIKQGWRELVGDNGRIVSIEHYGASADYARIYTEFGITAQAVADAARDSVAVVNA